MKIFLQIWIALKSQNEMLITIINIPMLAIELIITVLLFTKLLDIKATLKQKGLYIAFSLIVALLSQFVLPAPYNIIVNIFACPLIVLLIFKTTILKAILSEVLPFVFFGSGGLLIMKFYCSIFNISTETTMTTPIHKLFYSATLYLSIFIIYKLFAKFDISVNLIDKMRQRTSALFLFNFIIGSIFLIIQAYIIYGYIDSTASLFILLFILMSLTYFWLSLYSLSRTTKLEVTSKNLEEQRLYNKTLTILYDNIRGFKHDFNNIVQAIGGYINTKNMKGLSEYYSELIDDCQKVNNLTILSPEVINNPAIYSLLTSKYHKAAEINVHISLEVFLDLNTIKMKIYELTRMLGILIDNGIEAASKCEEKLVNITIRKDTKLNRQLFIIENTYLDKEINIDKIFEKGYTSKETGKKGHGLGLWEVRKVLKQNNNLNLYTTKNDKYFKQQLEIYY